MKTRLSRQSKRKQGTAAVEATVLLPFFLIVFVGFYYMVAVYGNGQRQTAKARSCGWTFARDGCEAVPDGCDSAHQEDPFDSDSKFGKVLNFLDKLNQLPPFDQFNIVDALYGQPMRARQSTEIPRPGLLGGGMREVGGQYYAVCNTKPRDWGTMKDEIVDAIFCKFIKGIPPCT